jgi:hypothetical protein
MRSKLSVICGAMALASAISVSAEEDLPKITGKPVIDAPAILEWPLDHGTKTPTLHNPISDTLYDLHGRMDSCDLVLSTEGNYHMALRDIWPVFLDKFSGDPLHNAVYTTSPPVVVPQLQAGTVQFDNLSVDCRPSVAVASKRVIDKLVAAGATAGAALPLYQDRGDVILVKKGNPKHIRTIWDLGRPGVRMVTPNPDVEPGAYGNYLSTIYNIAKSDPHPPRGWTAEKLIDVLYNGRSGDPYKWLAGPRIHHRDEPWSVAHGKADAAVILYHLGRFTKESFPDTFDIVPLGGTADNPQPLAGTKIGVRYVVALKGDWSPKQKKAQEALIAVLQSDTFTQALNDHGLQRPAADSSASGSN